MDARTILIRPVISEKSYALIAEGKYTFRVNDRAHKTQIAQAVQEVFGVQVAQVRTSKVRPKPKRRGLTKGRTRGWKKAVVQLAPGTTPSDALGDELIAYSRDHIATFKCPTSVVFLDDLPRLPTGKLAKRLLPESVLGLVD